MNNPSFNKPRSILQHGIQVMWSPDGTDPSTLTVAQRAALHTQAQQDSAKDKASQQHTVGKLSSDRLKAFESDIADQLGLTLAKVKKGGRDTDQSVMATLLPTDSEVPALFQRLGEIDQNTDLEAYKAQLLLITAYMAELRLDAKTKAQREQLDEIVDALERKEYRAINGQDRVEGVDELETGPVRELEELLEELGTTKAQGRTRTLAEIKQDIQTRIASIKSPSVALGADQQVDGSTVAPSTVVPDASLSSTVADAVDASVSTGLDSSSTVSPSTSISTGTGLSTSPIITETRKVNGHDITVEPQKPDGDCFYHTIAAAVKREKDEDITHEDVKRRFAEHLPDLLKQAFLNDLLDKETTLLEQRTGKTLDKNGRKALTTTLQSKISAGIHSDKYNEFLKTRLSSLAVSLGLREEGFDVSKENLGTLLADIQAGIQEDGRWFSAESSLDLMSLEFEMQFAMAKPDMLLDVDGLDLDQPHAILYYNGTDHYDLATEMDRSVLDALKTPKEEARRVDTEVLPPEGQKQNSEVSRVSQSYGPITAAITNFISLLLLTSALAVGGWIGLAVFGGGVALHVMATNKQHELNKEEQQHHHKYELEQLKQSGDREKHENDLTATQQTSEIQSQKFQEMVDKGVDPTVAAILTSGSNVDDIQKLTAGLKDAGAVIDDSTKSSTAARSTSQQPSGPGIGGG